MIGTIKYGLTAINVNVKIYISCILTLIQIKDKFDKQPCLTRRHCETIGLCISYPRDNDAKYESLV